MGPKIIWPKNVEIRSAAEVEKKPLLWDSTCSLYKRSDLKPLAWEEIAAKIGPPFPADMVAKRYKNMKETYAKNLAKVKSSKRSGSGSDDIFIPTWYLYQHLGYLQKACAQAESSDNIGATATQNTTLPVLNAEYNQETDRWILSPVGNTDSQSVGNTDSQGASAAGEMDHYWDGDDSALDELVSPFSPVSQQEIQRPASAPVQTSKQGTPSTTNDVFFKKRGNSKKTTAAVMASAAKAIEKLVDTPLPTVAAQETPSDAFCAMIGARLNSLSPEARKECENEILKVVLKY